jgi:AcrR family transcriptional regulator
MTGTAHERAERRAKERTATRASILEAARRVAGAAGARNLSLRGVAAEAGFAPAALYGYFDNKNELLLALAAEDLAGVARAMRTASHDAGDGGGKLAAASAVALSLLRHAETIAAATSALPPVSGSSESERVFNGRLIAVLTALSEAAGGRSESREAQTDVVVLAAALTGLAVMGRAGRLDALGFTTDELLARLEARFSGAL